MKKHYLAFTIGVLLAVVSAGCITTVSSGGTVNVYASDQPAALDDFESLDVTVDSVTFTRQVETENGTETEKITRELQEPRTFDLTQLVRDNATKLASFENVPNGTYTGVTLNVTDTNGTLKSGDSVDVMLPSQTLKVQQEFTVGDGEEVNFVYDMHVVKAGNSGKYIIRPVVAQSGADQPINPVDTDQGEGDLGARFVGDLTRGENATVSVTQGGDAVEGATVTVNGEEVGQTDENGNLTFTVPDTEELEVAIEQGDAEAELEFEFGEMNEMEDGETDDGGMNGTESDTPVNGGAANQSDA